MAATITAATVTDDAVARAASQPFTARGETVVVMPLVDLAVEGAETLAVRPDLPAVVLADRRRVECLVAEPAEPGLGASLAQLVAAGWDVVALVPAAEMGAAHRYLRGTGTALQPWWRDDAAISFGRPELP